jgi:nucleotide-binding universal stress UspA family protein/YHS domain-containing protein
MKVLVPYDGAELSEQAAVMAIELLAQHHLDIVLLHVAADDSHTASASAALKAAAVRLSGSPASVDPTLSFGNPAQEIVRCADQRGADLIAMSTHGRSELVRALVGSVTDRVIRTAPVPVLVFHPPTMSVDRMSPPTGRKLRVLIPLDGSEVAEEAATMSALLLNQGLIDVTLVSVMGTPQRETPVAREILDKAAAQLNQLGATTSTTILLGEAANQITAFAGENDYDLIVMATHGHGMLTRTLVGSTTDRVVRIADVPVLVIQPRSMETPFDPVSGETIDPDVAQYTSEYHGRTFAFTSLEHKQQFDGDPEAYIGRRLDRPTGLPSAAEGMAVGSTGEMAMVPPTLRDA